MKQVTLFSLIAIVIVLVGTMGYLSYSESNEHGSNDEHEHSVEIEGSEMKSLTVKQVADLWEIDEELLLSRIIAEFNLKGDYTINNILEDIREEYAFSPALIKDIAEEIKQPGIQYE